MTQIKKRDRSRPPMRQTSITLTDDLRRQVTFCAAARNEGMADFVRRALQNEVAKNASLFPARRGLDGGSE